MSSAVIQNLADRLESTDPARSQDQREIFERIRELRADFEGPMDPESLRYLEAASMLVAYLARMGSFAGSDVREIAVRLLRCAAEAEASAAGETPAPPVPAEPARPGPRVLRLGDGSLSGDLHEPERHDEPLSATDLLGDMMLGQILLQRGQILDEHIHQAVKVQRTTHMRIGDVFVKIGACSRKQVEEAIKHQSQLRRVRENIGRNQVPVISRPDTRGMGLKLVGEAMLGEILVERGVVTRSQLDHALEAQKATGGRIGEILVKLGATTMPQIEMALRVQGRERRFTKG